MSPVRTEKINSTYDEQGSYDGRYPPDWEARKKAVHRNNDYTCQDCGIKADDGKMLNVHHIKHLSDGGSNRLSNLTTLCIDCHNNRHDHDIRRDRDGYSSMTSIWDLFKRFVQLFKSVVGGLFILVIHEYVIIGVTQPIGSTSWLIGGGYLVLLAVGILLCPDKIAVLYTTAGVIGVVVLPYAPARGINGVSTGVVFLSPFVPALLAGMWWHQRR
ncbi:HNH endonuclease [Halocatena marina]|uniref:HNH endonuclease n=1 Tax=Halocatena marina TaxID=2934937 RepID=A0ABD5YWW9_9EURY